MSVQYKCLRNRTRVAAHLLNMSLQVDLPSDWESICLGCRKLNRLVTWSLYEQVIVDINDAQSLQSLLTGLGKFERLTFSSSDGSKPVVRSLVILDDPTGAGHRAPPRRSLKSSAAELQYHIRRILEFLPRGCLSIFKRVHIHRAKAMQ